MNSEKMGNYKVFPFESVEDANERLSQLTESELANGASVVSDDNNVIVIFVGVNERGRYCYLDNSGTFNTSEDIHTKTLP